QRGMCPRLVFLNRPGKRTARQVDDPLQTGAVMPENAGLRRGQRRKGQAQTAGKLERLTRRCTGQSEALRESADTGSHGRPRLEQAHHDEGARWAMRVVWQTCRVCALALRVLPDWLAVQGCTRQRSGQGWCGNIAALINEEPPCQASCWISRCPRTSCWLSTKGAPIES